MNIFKVLASSKKRFPEEHASVILAWLLNPHMDHGLGFIFLREFLSEAAPDIFTDLDKSLQNILRSERSTEKLNFSADIEYNVKNTFIDIVLFINNYIIAIENKILSESASNKEQLVYQYEGLKEKFAEKYKIRIVFLVPDEMHPYVKNEYEALEKKYPQSDKERTIINWNVISKIIKKIIIQDSKCKISPINDNLRYILKAFSVFIDDDFSGYYFENEKSYGSMNPLAEGRKKLDEIINDNSIKYVGVNYGIIGLLTLTKEDLEKKTFQFTSEKIDSSRWLDKDIFINIGNSIIKKEFKNIDWIKNTNTRFPYDVIYNIANKTETMFYIGIRDGENALENMENEKIEKSQWSISLEKQNSQWIEKDKYLQILKKKGICI